LDLVLVVIYGISGLLAAIGGILVMGRLQSGAYQNGTNMTLISVAAVVIGGTALSGGIGGIWGTLVGVFIIRVVDAGLVYLDVPSNAKEIVWWYCAGGSWRIRRGSQVAAFAGDGFR
jgi:ribose transport system permease protein